MNALFDDNESMVSLGTAKLGLRDLPVKLRAHKLLI